MMTPLRNIVPVLVIAPWLCGIALAGGLPPDVAAFVEERQQCDHFRGEEAYDDARRVEIDRALDRFCTGTDARLKKLKAKHAKGPQAVKDILDSFEKNIE